MPSQRRKQQCKQNKIVRNAAALLNSDTCWFELKSVTLIKYPAQLILGPPQKNKQQRHFKNIISMWLTFYLFALINYTAAYKNRPKDDNSIPSY